MIITIGREDQERMERMEQAQRHLSLVLDEVHTLRAENRRLLDIVRAHRIPNVTAPGSPPGRIAPADYALTSRAALVRMDQLSRVIRAEGRPAVPEPGPGISENLAAHLNLDEG